MTLTPQQCRRLGHALRRGAMDSLRIADAIDAAGRTHLHIEVSDMGQFAKDWESLKQLIGQKDDALDRASVQLTSQSQQLSQQTQQLSTQTQQLAQQSQQITALQQQVASLQTQFDADDQKAAAELHQTIAQNPPPTNDPAVTTFVK